MSLTAGKTPSFIEIDPNLAPAVTMPDRAYAVLKHKVLTCALAPGERIIEKNLCEELGISRTPLREALNRLAHEGLVVLASYKGYSVAPLTVQSFHELCELRRMIEPQVAAVAAERATAADLEKIKATAVLEYVVGDPESYLRYNRANSAFHLAVVRSIRNERVESVFMGILDQHHRPTYLGLNFGIDAVTSTAEHFAIYEAIRQRNAGLARELAHHHIAAGESRIIAALKTAGY